MVLPVVTTRSVHVPLYMAMSCDKPRVVLARKTNKKQTKNSASLFTKGHDAVHELVSHVERRMSQTVKHATSSFDRQIELSSSVEMKTPRYKPFPACVLLIKHQSTLDPRSMSLDYILINIPPKPLTLDLFFRGACYHRNASYRKMKRKKKLRKNYTFTNSVLFIFGTWFIQRS
jgi:hypothetical protein